MNSELRVRWITLYVVVLLTLAIATVVTAALLEWWALIPGGLIVAWLRPIAQILRQRSRN